MFYSAVCVWLSVFVCLVSWLFSLKAYLILESCMQCLQQCTTSEFSVKSLLTL